MNIRTEVEVDVDVDMSVQEVYDAMDDEDKAEMAALLMGATVAMRPEGWLLTQMEIECAQHKLPPYTREYLEQTTGRPIGLI
ncbi:MAG: hypothetical protein KBC57_03345 [Neisseriaceae bacterium]|nr:hypothetical protein [Neisseriaceae bacterium]